MTAPNIVLVEDDPPLRTLTTRALQENGYTVRPAATAPEMWRAFEQGPVDLVLLDIMLPGTSGIDLCRELRRTSDVPIIFISAKGSETDRVVGLELGADDYLAKPFDMDELAARLSAIARRNAPRPEGSQLEVGRLQLDPSSHRARYRDASAALNRKQYSLLAHLMRNADRLVTRSMLLESVWAYSFSPTTNIVESNMSRLRTALLGLGCDPIETQRGAGYTLRSDRCA